MTKSDFFWKCVPERWSNLRSSNKVLLPRNPPPPQLLLPTPTPCRPFPPPAAPFLLHVYVQVAVIRETWPPPSPITLVHASGMHSQCRCSRYLRLPTVSHKSRYGSRVTLSKVRGYDYAHNYMLPIFMKYGKFLPEIKKRNYVNFASGMTQELLLHLGKNVQCIQ